MSKRMNKNLQKSESGSATSLVCSYLIATSSVRLCTLYNTMWSFPCERPFFILITTY